VNALKREQRGGGSSNQGQEAWSAAHTGGLLLRIDGLAGREPANAKSGMEQFYTDAAIIHACIPGLRTLGAGVR